MNPGLKSQVGEALYQPVPVFDRHVLWAYGTGNVGVGDGQLSGPHTAEENPFNPDEIVVAEQYGCDILLISRASGKLRVLYGARGVAGGGDHLTATHSAHFMPAGPYKGHVLITEYAGEARVMIIDGDTGRALWCCADFEAPLDAIYWDDEHIMVSDRSKGIYRMRLTDRATVWHYDSEPHGHPFYLHRLTRSYCDSYGGDLLVGFWGPNAVVREIDPASKKTVWIYGERKEQGRGDLYDRLLCPVRALRYGIQENGGGLTIICDEWARILCVNRDKELVWELGGANAEHLRPATPLVVLPTNIHVTKRGTLLVTDWGRNTIYEINPFCIPRRTEKDAYLFRDYETTGDYADSGIIESRGYRDKNVQVYNTHEASGVLWRVLGSHNARDWQVIHAPSEALSAGQASYALVDGPWNFIKAHTKSAVVGKSSRVNVYISMRR